MELRNCAGQRIKRKSNDNQLKTKENESERRIAQY